MNKQSLLLILAVSASAIGLNGCSTKAESGAAIGSLVGAGIGKSTANHRDRRALVGAVVGGIVGGAIGDAQDRSTAASRSTTTHSVSNHTHAQANRQVAAKPSISHRHGNRTHSHPGGAGQHAHNTGTTHTAAQNQQVVTRTVYVDRPYYVPVARPSIVIGTRYYPKRKHRVRHHRHNRRHVRHGHFH